MPYRLILKFLFFQVLFLSIIELSHASESSVYDFSWLDSDKEIYVLQNRKYRKIGKAEASVGYGMTVSGAFVDASALQARFSYFFKEDWGFQFLYSKNSGSENDAAKSVRNAGGPGSTPFRRIVDNYMAGMLLWSPFYGKINTFNKIVYFDWILGAGYGKLEETNNRDELTSGALSSKSLKTETHSTFFLETGLKFYINKSFNLNLNLTAGYYKAKNALTKPSDVYYSNYDLTVSAGYSF